MSSNVRCNSTSRRDVQYVRHVVLSDGSRLRSPLWRRNRDEAWIVPMRPSHTPNLPLGCCGANLPLSTPLYYVPFWNGTDRDSANQHSANQYSANQVSANQNSTGLLNHTTLDFTLLIVNLPTLLHSRIFYSGLPCSVRIFVLMMFIVFLAVYLACLMSFNVFVVYLILLNLIIVLCNVCSVFINVFCFVIMHLAVL